MINQDKIKTSDLPEEKNPEIFWIHGYTEAKDGNTKSSRLHSGKVVEEIDKTTKAMEQKIASLSTSTTNELKKKADAKDSKGKSVVYGEVATNTSVEQKGKLVDVELLNAELAKKDNLIAEYVHSGNKELHIESIDYTTNTFYSPNHGLNDSDRLGINILGLHHAKSKDFLPLLPLNIMIMKGIYISNVTVDTFQVISAVGAAPISLINQNTVDLESFRFEVVKDKEFVFEGFSEKGVVMELIGQFARNPRYITANKYSLAGYLSTRSAYALLFHDLGYSLGGIYRVDISIGGRILNIARNWDLINFSSKLNEFTMITGKFNSFQFVDELPINQIVIYNGCALLNGCTIKIYRK